MFIRVYQDGIRSVPTIFKAFHVKSVVLHKTVGIYITVCYRVCRVACNTRRIKHNPYLYMGYYFIRVFHVTNTVKTYIEMHKD